jgi:hypothetical protein
MRSNVETARLAAERQAEIDRLREEIKRLKEDKAVDWKACCECAHAASIEINQLRAMVREFVHRP